MTNLLKLTRLWLQSETFQHFSFISGLFFSTTPLTDYRIHSFREKSCQHFPFMKADYSLDLPGVWTLCGSLLFACFMTLTLCSDLDFVINLPHSDSHTSLQACLLSYVLWNSSSMSGRHLDVLHDHILFTTSQLFIWHPMNNFRCCCMMKFAPTCLIHSHNVKEITGIKSILLLDNQLKFY